MTEKLVVGFAGVARAIRVMLGAPDYERYLEHVRSAHPDCKPMSRDDFVKERLNSKYSKPGARCC